MTPHRNAMLLCLFLVLAGCLSSEPITRHERLTSPLSPEEVPAPDPGDGETPPVEREKINDTATIAPTVAACPPGVEAPTKDGCAGAFWIEYGNFTIQSGAADLVLTATWEPENPTVENLRLSLATDNGEGLIKEFVAHTEGKSPLSLRVDALAPGSYLVRPAPSSLVGVVLDRQSVEWQATFTMASPPGG